MDKRYFQTDDDWYIASVYIAPKNSPIHDIYNVDIFQKLEQDITHYSQIGRVIIAGDNNSRVGQKCDFLQNESITDLDLNHILNDKPCPRRSMDYKNNRFGDIMLDLCKAVNICLVNGRSRSIDDNGKMTCITHNGESMIWY